MVLPEALYENRQILNRISICSSKDKALSFPQRKCFNILILPPGLWLVTLGNGTLSGDHYLSLLFAYLILSSRCDQLRLAEWQFILLSTCIIPISATLFMGPLSNDRNDWAKRPTVYRMGHPVYLITGLLLWWCYPLMSIYKNTVSSYSSPIWGDQCTYYFSVVFLTNFPIMFFPSLWSSRYPVYSP